MGELNGGGTYCISCDFFRMYIPMCICLIILITSSGMVGSSETNVLAVAPVCIDPRYAWDISTWQCGQFKGDQSRRPRYEYILYTSRICIPHPSVSSKLRAKSINSLIMLFHDNFVILQVALNTCNSLYTCIIPIYIFV